MNRKTRVKVVVVAISAIIVLLLLATVAHKAYQSRCVVQNAEDAMSIARVAFVKTFGEEEQNRPLKAKHSGWKGTWHVYGILPDGMLGGTPEAIISERTGEVIRIWHGK